MQSMSLNLVRDSLAYQKYIRPFIWAPISAYRAYGELRAKRFYEELAREDIKSLAQARREVCEEHANEPEPLVSITTATYNRARILVESTLPAVQAQSYKNIEWVIVGDHCTDNTGDLLAQVHDPRVRFVNLPKRPRYPRDKRKRWKVAGVPPINVALDLARGSWVAHLDDDDVFTPDHIEKLLIFARAGDYELVSGVSRLEMLPGEWIEKGRIVQGQGPWPQFSHSTVLYRSYLGRCFRYDARCLKVNSGADGFRWRRMLHAGVRAGFLQEVVTHMSLRPGEGQRSIFQPE
jgi:glycosyltransferase involved in cell wall biosynthesis